MLAIFSLFFGALMSWYITRWYFLASQKDLEAVNSNLESKISQLLIELRTFDASNKIALLEEKIEKAIQEYKHSGTPKKYIDSLNDLDNNQKAELFDDVFMRVKGRKAKQNPYETKSNTRDQNDAPL